MPILLNEVTSTTTNWFLTLSREEYPQLPANSSETAIVEADITLPKYGTVAITAITGSGTTRNVTFNHGLFELSANDIVIDNTKHPRLIVTNVVNTNAPTTPSTDWVLTLNRAVGAGLAPEPIIVPGDITIANNSVTRITGQGLQRGIHLDTALSELGPDDITISNHPNPDIEVTAVTANVPVPNLISSSPLSIANLVLAQALDNIRNYLEIGLTRDELPNKTIIDGYLPQAEEEIYSILHLTPTEYDTRASASTAFSSKTRLAAQYRAAALIVPALPEILTEEINRERQTFAEFEPEKKIQFFLDRSETEIQEFVPTGEAVTGYVAGSFKRRPICF